MLKCRDVPQQAERLIAGDLTFWQRFSLRFHLFICRDCRRYVRQLRTLLGALSRMQNRRPAQSVDTDALLARLQHNEPHQH